VGTDDNPPRESKISDTRYDTGLRRLPQNHLPHRLTTIVVNRSAPPQYDFLDPPGKEGEIGRLGPYRITGLLGKGGFGQVFVAEDARLKRRVALKVMTQKFAATPNSKKRFVEEARAMAAVHHDNVATIFEVGLRTGMPFIAMEMLKGKTLEGWTSEGRPFNTEQILQLGRDVACGLSAAHACGIVHRDIKPANIWIENSGRAKILDFGLAIAGPDRFSRRGTVMGTPGFLSPEQARNEPVDDRTDLYSLGVVLYQMSAGKLPLVSDSVTGQMIAIIAHRPQMLQSINSDIPKPLSDLVAKLLEKEPRDRIQSAVMLEKQIDEVTRLCHSDSQAALQIVTAEPATVPSKAVKKQAAKKQAANDAPVRSAKRATWIPWASAAALLVIVILVGLLGRPRRVANAPVILSDGTPQSRADPAVVRASSLGVLSLSSVSEAAPPVPRGDQVQFEVRIENHALDARSDPRQVNKGSKHVAQVSAYRQIAGNQKGPQLGYAKKLSAGQLPQGGESKTIEIVFLTAEFLPGEFNVIFELQSPGGEPICSDTAKLTVTENLARGDRPGP
jgi:serine/threonine protein kinase